MGHLHMWVAMLARRGSPWTSCFRQPRRCCGSRWRWAYPYSSLVPRRYVEKRGSTTELARSRGIDETAAISLVSSISERCKILLHGRPTKSVAASVMASSAAAKASKRQEWEQPVNKPLGARPRIEGGTVKWFNGAKGYGFISCTTGDDVFVHYSAISRDGAIKEGDSVQFIVVEGPKGLEAKNVQSAPKVKTSG